MERGTGGGLTVGLEVAAGVDGLELVDGGARRVDVGRLERRALDEARRAAGVAPRRFGFATTPNAA